MYCSFGLLKIKNFWQITSVKTPVRFAICRHRRATEDSGPSDKDVMMSPMHGSQIVGGWQATGPAFNANRTCRKPSLRSACWSFGNLHGQSPHRRFAPSISRQPPWHAQHVASFHHSLPASQELWYSQLLQLHCCPTGSLRVSAVRCHSTHFLWQSLRRPCPNSQVRLCSANVALIASNGMRGLCSCVRPLSAQEPNRREWWQYSS